jgi:tetratricopeptide (TPR) repeat protein
MDTDNTQSEPSNPQGADDVVTDSVLDSMAAALESAGISMSPEEPAPVPEKRYSDEVMRQVIVAQNIEDENGFIEFAKTMDGDENGYLNKQELVDAAEAYAHMNAPQEDEEATIEEEVAALLQEGEENSRNNNPKEALVAFNKAIALDPSCDMAWFNRGVLLEAQQDARGARQAFQICLDLNEEHAPATANLAILLERIGDEVGAYDMASRALVFFPGHPTLTELQARCKGSGESVEIEEMPVIEPTQTFSEAQVKKVMEETGATDRDAVLAEAVHHDDGNENLEFSELMAAAEVVAATEVVEVTLQGQPALLHDEPEPVVEPAAPATVVPEEQTIPAAIPEPVPAQQVATAEPTIDLDHLVEEATQMIRAGAPGDALNLLKPHLKTIGAQHAGAWRIAGGAMARLDLDDHAIGALTHAQTLDPTQASGWFNLGSIHQRKGDSSKAIEAYLQALDAQPSYLKAALKCSMLCYEVGDIERYLTASRAVINADPTNEIRHQLVEVLIGLAEGEANVLEASQGLPPTLPEGPQMAQEALNLLGQGSTQLHARAYSASNDHVQSVTLWRSLIQNDGQNAENWRGLARSLENAGDLETAQKCHAKASGLEQELGTDAATIAPISEPATPVIAPTPAPAPAPAPAPVVEQTPAFDALMDTPVLETQTTVAPALTGAFAPPTNVPVPPQVPPNANQAPPNPDDAAADFYMGALGLNNEPQAPEFNTQPASSQPTYDAGNDILMQPIEARPIAAPQAPQPEVDLAKAALDATSRVALTTPGEVNSMSIANQDIAWYNQGVQLIDDGKFDKALSSFDRALPSFANDDDMLIRILNGKGNAYYYLEQYPKCVEAYHQAMLIRPAEVRGKTLYNMGSAYAEMERYPDAIKCFEQSIPRGLQQDEVARARDQIRRCSILQKERARKARRK